MPAGFFSISLLVLSSYLLDCTVLCTVPWFQHGPYSDSEYPVSSPFWSSWTIGPLSLIRSRTRYSIIMTSAKFALSVCPARSTCSYTYMFKSIAFSLMIWGQFVSLKYVLCPCLHPKLKIVCYILFMNFISVYLKIL